MLLRFDRPVVLPLAAGEHLTWTPRTAATLKVRRGRVWVTRPNDPDDHFLQPGDHVTLGPGMLIGADAMAEVLVQPAPAATIARWTPWTTLLALPLLRRALPAAR